jgi:hypothetical protein
MTTKKSEGTTQLKQNTKQLLFMLEEAIPVEQVARREYTSDIAFFYAKHFKKKLQHFIGLQLEELAQIGRSETLNDMIRSNINCFRLIDEWMEKMTNEHFGDIEEARKSVKEGDTIIKDLRNKYGKN